MSIKRMAFAIVVGTIALSGCSASVSTGYPAHYGFFDSYGYWHRY
jgi:hypothetical protein